MPLPFPNYRQGKVKPSENRASSVEVMGSTFDGLEFHRIGETVALANGLTATVGLSGNEERPVAIDVSGFRSFSDVMSTENLSLADLLVIAVETTPGAGKVTVGRFDCPTTGPAQESRTVIANHHRSRIRMSRLRFTPPSHFATFIYDLDDANASLLTNALREAAETWR